MTMAKLAHITRCDLPGIDSVPLRMHVRLLDSGGHSQGGASRDRGEAAARQRGPAVLGYRTLAEFISKETAMNDSAPSKPVPESHCPDCKQPMRVLTMLPMLNGMWDLSFKCDQCGKVSDVMHKPEDRQAR